MPYRKASDYSPPETVQVWDENWDALHLFIGLQSQWRAGAFGLIGLDFNVFMHELDRKKIPEADYDTYLQQLRVIEAEALRQINSNN